MTEDDTLTLRDRFAMAALTGMCANPEIPQNDEAELAKWSYDLADAMLAEREKKR